MNFFTLFPFFVFLFLVFFHLGNCHVLNFKNNEALKLEIDTSLLSLLCPTLHQNSLVEKNHYYCHCAKQDWLAFIRFLVSFHQSQQSQNELQVHETVKTEFNNFKAKILANETASKRLHEILKAESPFESQLEPSVLVNLWASEFKWILFVVSQPLSVDPSLNFASHAYRIYPNSQIYIQCSLNDLKYFKSSLLYFKGDLVLQPKAVLNFSSLNQPLEYCFIGPVDSVFKADSVDLKTEDLDVLFGAILGIESLLRDRKINQESGKIEKYLFLHQGRLRFAIPLLFRDNFPFKNSLEILNQMAILMPRYNKMFEDRKVVLRNLCEALILKKIQLGKDLTNDEGLKHFSKLYQIYHAECINLIPSQSRASIQPQSRVSVQPQPRIQNPPNVPHNQPQSTVPVQPQSSAPAQIESQSSLPFKKRKFN